MRRMLNPLEIVDRQNIIIKIQADAINELFLLLMEHIGAEEADRLPVVAKLNHAAEIRREIE